MSIRNLRETLATLVFAFIICSPQLCYALAISPVDLEILSRRPQGYYSIINDGNSEKTIAIYGGTRIVDENGDEEIGPTGDLVIYPKLVVLKPNEKRVVRVLWKAKQKLSSEVAYRIIFEEQNFQLPTSEKELDKVDESQMAGISLGIKFVGTIFVQPHNKLKPNLKLVDYKIIQEDGKDVLAVRIENAGSKRMYLDPRTLEIELKGKGTDAEEGAWIPISEEQIKESLKKCSTLLSHHKRVLKLPLEQGLPREITSLRVTE